MTEAANRLQGSITKKTYISEEEGAVLQTKHVEIFYIGRDAFSQTTIRNVHSPNFSFNWEKIKCCMIADLFINSLFTELYSNV